MYRLAQQLGLRGSVRNTGSGVIVEVEGPAESLQAFLARLEAERPPASVILARRIVELPAIGDEEFRIEPSQQEADKLAGLLPDLATCTDCLRELFDPSNRRYLYPFINCTQCGPRYTIIRAIPYDRPNTTMHEFRMCEDCSREYHDPADRRFHAQPVACPACGPQLNLPLEEAAECLRQGKIVALKGIGGFQLLVDARNEQAVARLRERKRRQAKPFALMMASLDQVRRYCYVSAEEEWVLQSPAAPIVLLRPKPGHDIAPAVTCGSPYLGVMLPYSPLHHLLMRAFPHPVVATSGNRSEEPIAIDNREALERLGDIADTFLMHDRPIARPCDDSVVRVSRGELMILRRARGYAPLPIWVGIDLPKVLAVGAHLKNTVAIAVGQQVVLSQHVGDLDTYESRLAFEKAIRDLCTLYDFEPELVVCDLHPDYYSTQWARSGPYPVVGVQHHRAHVAACAAENQLREAYLGVAWDGTGYGEDGTLWGGEFFGVSGSRFERLAHLRPFLLPGGEAAVREGWRVAASLCWELGLPYPAPALLRKAWERAVNCPVSTSVGRLFDAVAALLGIAHTNRFEGDAAMRLEAALREPAEEKAYPLPGGDWRPLIEAVWRDCQRGVAVETIAARFHNALVQWIVEVAEQVGLEHVVLSGGVFQNRYLSERASEELARRKHRVYTHHQVPPNDGGIALGQVILATLQPARVPLSPAAVAPLATRRASEGIGTAGTTKLSAR